MFKRATEWKPIAQMSPTDHLDETLPAVPESVAFARALVDAVEPPLPDETLRSARLLVSELVTNAIRHGAGTAVRVALERRSDVLRIEVHDQGDGFVARPRDPDHHKGSGWGLHFVSRLARRWGVEADGGTTVWLELPLRSPGPRSGPLTEPAQPSTQL